MIANAQCQSLPTASPTLLRWRVYAKGEGSRFLALKCVPSDPKKLVREATEKRVFVLYESWVPWNVLPSIVFEPPVFGWRSARRWRHARIIVKSMVVAVFVLLFLVLITITVTKDPRDVVRLGAAQTLLTDAWRKST